MKTAAIALLLATLAACSGKPAAPEATGGSPAPVEAPEETTSDDTLPKTTITLFFPSSTEDALVQETREILDTARPAERGTQVLVELLAGPQTADALPAVPPGTTLRQLWIAKNGIAWADFSDEISTGLQGGSADELLTVYAIVDSLAASVPQIKRVGLLVGGRERDTLAGHVDIRRPLPPHPKEE